MSKSQAQRSATSDNPGDLPGAVARLADCVQMLYTAIDELRSSIKWGLQNNLFRSPEVSTAEPVEVDHEQIDATVREACAEMTGEMRDAVRDGVRAELQAIRDSLNDVSTDIDFAARKIREKPTEELSELRETLQGELVELRGSMEQFMTEIHDAVTQIHDAVRREKQGTLFDPCVMDVPHVK